MVVVIAAIVHTAKDYSCTLSYRVAVHFFFTLATIDFAIFAQNAKSESLQNSLAIVSVYCSVLQREKTLEVIREHYKGDKTALLEVSSFQSFLWIKCVPY